jgi:predicted flap endonuclease-1-like 5' DNA nuclease
METFFTGILLIGFGLLAAFFGYRFFRFLLPVFGGFAGFIIASNLLPNNWFLAFIVGIGIAIVLALLSYWIWSFMFTISGALSGAALGAAIANTLNLWDWVAWLIVIGAAILFGFLVWKFRDEMVIVITSLAGAGMVADGLRTWFGDGTIRDIIWLGVFIAVAVLGILFQWRAWLKYNLYRDINRAKAEYVASGKAADLSAQARTAAPAVAAGAATATAASKAAAADATAAATTVAVATKAAAVDVTAAAAETVAKLTPEEKLAALNKHLDELVATGAAPSTLSDRVSELKDVSPDQEAKLKGAGLALVVDILRRGATKTGRAELSRATDIPEATILSWVNFADLMRIKGVGPAYSRLLEAAGVDTVVELSQRNPANLHAKLVEVNEAQKLAGRTPRAEEVVDWVAQAKELPRIIEY